MTPNEAEAVVAVATLAALADGQQDPQEQATIAAVATRLGLASDVMQRAASGALSVTELATRFTSDESRQTAYDAALAVCSGDGEPSLSEHAFLTTLASALNISPANASNPFAGAVTNGAVPVVASAASAMANAKAELDNHILDQAILTAAMELLPDRLANMAILPLQMRLVYGIGQRHGQQLDVRQVTDLAATFGIGAMAQVFEKVVRRTLGGLAGGLLGGLLGGATGVASGAVVTFAATYALGHAAEQYYAQNRSLSVPDMKALFARFQAEATEMYPRVQDRIRQRAGGTSVSSVMASLRG
jgi:tellurite resistance protein/uncharacterized protein (DUF697 family)